MNDPNNPANRLAGTVYVTIGNQRFNLVGQCRYSPSYVSREAVIGMNGFAGYSEKATLGKISVLLRDDPALTVGDLQEMTNGTVVVELANGKTVTGRGMFVANVLEVDTETAAFEVQFEGESVEELFGGRA